MPTSTQVQSNVVRISRLIESDIRRKGLSSGEPYMTAIEAGNQLSVHPRTVGRAMRILAARKILLSKPGVGTFVGSEIGKDSGLSPIRSVHVVMSAEGLCDLPLQQLVEGIATEVSNCDVQLNFLPQDDVLGYMRRVLTRGADDGAMVGLVLVSCPRSVQELVLQHNVPAVVFGTNYPTTRSLVSVDVNQFEVGRLMAQHLCRNGHRKIAMLTHELWLPGDNLFFDGVRDSLEEAELGHGALVLRSVSTDVSVVEAELEQLLSSKDRPTGLICRSHFFAKAALRVAGSMEIRVPTDLDIVFDGTLDNTLLEDSVSIPFVQADVDCETQCASVGRILSGLSDGKKPESNRVAFGVHLCGIAGSKGERASSNPSDV